MFHRFTDRAKQTMACAREQAIELGHDSIDTAHVFLALLGLSKLNVAAETLKRLGADSDQLREQVASQLAPGSHDVRGNVPFTAAAKHMLEYSMEEASLLGHNYIGSEHLLLGLIREADGLPARALATAGVELKAARLEIQKLLDEDFGEASDTVADAGVDSLEPVLPQLQATQTLLRRLLLEQSRLKTLVRVVLVLVLVLFVDALVRWLSG